MSDEEENKSWPKNSSMQGQLNPCFEQQQSLLLRMSRETIRHLQFRQEFEGQFGKAAKPLLKRLFRTGALKGWKLAFNRQKLGLEITAFIGVKLVSQDRGSLSIFREDIQRQPQVIQLHMLHGDYDFLLECVGVNMDAFNKFRRNCVNSHPLVRGTTTLIAIDP